MLGVPVESKALKGLDSLLSIVQMPAGVPVGTLAIGKAGRGQCRPARRRDPRDHRRGAGATARRHGGARQTDGVAEAPGMIGRMIPPGSTIGILGGGQLGRMLAIAAAAARLSLPYLRARRRLPPAAEVAARFTRGAIRRRGRARPLRRASRCRHLRVREYRRPARSPRSPARRRSTRRAESLEIAQDRLAEKDFVARLGGRPAPFARGRRPRRARRGDRRLGTPAILKTRRFGYDGKGQARIDVAGRCRRGLGGDRRRAGGARRLRRFRRRILDPALPRPRTARRVTWDAPRNVHDDGILDTLDRPRRRGLAAAIAEAEALARRIADALGHVGVLALEFFAAADGAVFNEMAPRVHNSGHWTIEGALTSQFENHIRAICGLPLGATALAAPRVRWTI